MIKFKFNKLLVFLFFAFGILSVGANEISTFGTSNTIQSLDWQKMSLQDNFRKKYENVISKVLVSNKFVVNVKIELNPPEKVKPVKSKNDFKNTKIIKFNNSQSVEGKADSIIFSKLGLEAPLIADEDNYKRESLKKTIEEISTKFDIFSFLQSVSIEVLLNEKLAANTRKAVEDLILTAEVVNSPKIKPKISIKYIYMDEGYVPTAKVEPTFLEKIEKLAPKYANGMSLIISVLLLGVVCFLLFNKYFEMQKKHLELLNSKAQKVENKNDNKNKDKDKNNNLKNKYGSLGEMADSISDEESLHLFDRFRTFLRESPIEAQLLLKKWIDSGDELATLALNSIIKQLNNEELHSVFEILTTEERKKWKSLLKLDLSDDELKIGNKYLSTQIVEDMMAPPLVKDHDVIKIITSLTPKQGAKIAKEDFNTGTILLNIMPPKFSAEMLEVLGREYADDLIVNSARLTELEILARVEHFKENLPVLEAAAEKSPFIENLLNHIAFASGQTERTLFKLLLEFEGEESVLQQAISSLPIDVITKAPDRVVRLVLQNMVQALRIQYLYNQNDDVQLRLLNLLAPEGSKARDLISFEFDKISKDPALNEEVKNKALTLEKEYNSIMRKLVRGNPEYAKEIKPIILDWIHDLIASNVTPLNLEPIPTVSSETEEEAA